MDINKINKVRTNFIAASQKLNFRITFPYIPNNVDAPKTIFAFLPDYGSANGTIISLMGEDFSTDRAISTWAKYNHIFYSFISIQAYIEYDEDQIKDTLTDWGYFGDPKDKPVWLKKSPWT